MIDIVFDGERPISASFNSEGNTGLIAFDYLVDASGRTGLISTKYLKNRKMNASFKNIACWGYWTGAKAYKPGTSRQNAPYFEAMTDEHGWGWLIPLHNGRTSVGFVMDSETSAKKRKESNANGGMKEHYLDQLQFVPSIAKFLRGATMIAEESVRSASDYSYAASCYAGDHFRIAGDAGGMSHIFVLFPLQL